MIYCMVGFPVFSSTGFCAAAPAEETVKLSKKEKKKLVEQGVAQYKEGERAQAKKTLEQAKAVFPANYAVPYYLGLIYLEEGQRSAAIAEWQQYVLMDTKSENSLKIRKHLTLLLREEAKESAKQALANEASLLQGPADENTVAISAFKNLGSENLGPLGKGMAALLIHDLSQVPDLQVVERVKLQALLQEMNLGTSGLVDPKTAPKLGKLLKARHVTTGNLADIEKENMQIASALVDAEQMESINTQEAQGALKRFYDLEKEIACEIIEDLGRDCDKMPGAFGKIHTKSLVALTSFGVGLDYLDQEKYDDAREAFQKALDEDPKFDLAEQALMATPVAAMLLMGTSETISGLSSSGFSSAAAGSAVVGGVGIGTTAAVVAAIAGGAAAAASGGGGSSGSSSSTSTDVSEATESDFIGTYQATDPFRTYEQYHGTFTFDSGGTGFAVEVLNGETLEGPIGWSFDESTDIFSVWVVDGGSFSGPVTGTTDNFTLDGTWSNGEPGTVNFAR
jgi:tetratricopeptide (TPR) repeat protein